MRLRGGGLESSDEDSEATAINLTSVGALSEGGGHEEETHVAKRGKEGDDSFDHFVPVRELKRPRCWSVWEERTHQRPAPLEAPRIPTLEYCNMTVRAVEDEDGIQSRQNQPLSSIVKGDNV